jgi:putative SOS response-associated peptidase YedK
VTEDSPKCGRAGLSSDVSEIKVAFRIPPERPAPNFPASWNVAPTDPVPVVRYDAKEHQRSLDLLRCGLIPHWANEIKVGSNINAKAEGIETRRAFRDAFERRRCLVPADYFYEWKQTARASSLMPLHSPIAASWRWRACGKTRKSSAEEWVRSFAIITTEPNELFAQLHNRMPVVLSPEAWPASAGTTNGQISLQPVGSVGYGLRKL